MQIIKASPNTSVILRLHILFTGLYCAQFETCLPIISSCNTIHFYKEGNEELRETWVKKINLSFAIQSKLHYWSTSLSFSDLYEHDEISRYT